MRTSVLMKFRFGSKNILADYDRDEKTYGQRNAQWRMHDCISTHKKANIRQRKKRSNLHGNIHLFHAGFSNGRSCYGASPSYLRKQKKNKKNCARLRRQSVNGRNFSRLHSATSSLEEQESTGRDHISLWPLNFTPPRLFIFSEDWVLPSLYMEVRLYLGKERWNIQISSCRIQRK